MNATDLSRALSSYYNSEEVRLSFDMYHPTAADREPQLDWSSSENYYRSRARQAEFRLERYELEWREKTR